MNSIKAYTLFLLIFYSVLPINAQSPVLENYIKIGLANNLALKQQTIDLQKGEEAIQYARGYFLPTVSFNASYLMSAGGRSIPFPIGDLLNPVYSTLNKLTNSTNFPQVENVTVNLTPTNYQETKIRVGQVLFNPSIKPNIEIQKELLNAISAKKTAYEHTLRYEITDAYLNLLKATEAEKIYQETKVLLTELLRFNTALVKNNVATREIISTAEYEISKIDNSIFQLQQTQKSARAYFNFLINNENLETPIELDSNLVKQPFFVYQKDNLLNETLTKRSEIAQLKFGLNATAISTKLLNDKARLPTLQIGGEAGFQGYGYHLADKQAFALAQISGQWTLFQGYQNKSKWQESVLDNQRLQLQLTQLENGLRMQTTKALNEYEAAKFSLTSAEKAIKSANESFKIVEAKYKQQQTLLIEYLEAENRVTTAKLQLVLARFEVFQKESELKNAIGF